VPIKKYLLAPAETKQESVNSGLRKRLVFFGFDETHFWLKNYFSFRFLKRLKGHKCFYLKKNCYAEILLFAIIVFAIINST